MSIITEQALPRVAISACLTGQRVRYDGTDKAQPDLLEALRSEVDLAPVCPEVGAGMATPRPPIQLVQSQSGSVRVVGRDRPDLDVTGPLHRYTETVLKQLLTAGHLCGWIFKSRSPSCGLGSTPRYSVNGARLQMGDGVQAALVRRRAPWLVLREETELAEPAQQREFIALCRLVWDLCHSGRPLQDLAEQHRPLIALLASQARYDSKWALAAGYRKRYCKALVQGLASAPTDEWVDMLESSPC